MTGSNHATKLNTALRYFFHIGYKGTHYHGWQRHPYGVNVQQTIEAALQSVLKVPCPIVGCGRTDAGVHASQFFFHLDVPQAWDFDMVYRLNKILPPDISVFDLIPVPATAHARFDATLRSYDYFIHTYKDPFLSELSALYLSRPHQLDAMLQATALLPLYSDYKHFCITPADQPSTTCHILDARWLTDQNGDRWRFQISANRFLSRMIRIVVGKLWQVGTGKLSLDAFESYLAIEAKPKTLSPAYPQGLYLSKVSYPYLDLPARASYAPMLRQQNWLPV